VESSAALIDAVLPVTENPKHRFVTNMDYRREGIQLERSPVLGESFFESVQAHKTEPVPHVCKRIIRIKSDRLSKLLLGRGVIVVVEQSGPSQRGARLPRLVDFQRLARQGFGFGSALRWRHKTPKPGGCAHISQPDVGGCKSGVLVDRLPKILAALLQSFGR